MSIQETNLPDFFLFRDLLLCQKYYQAKDLKQSKFYFNSAIQHTKNNELDIYPILKGRIAAWDYILNDSHEMFHLFYPKLLSSLDYAWFIMFYYRLIWIYKDNTFINDDIEMKSINKFQSLVSVYTQEIISKYCIIYSQCLLIKNKPQGIQDLLQHVNFEIFYVGEHVWFRELYSSLLKSKKTTNPSKLKANSPVALKQKQKVV